MGFPTSSTAFPKSLMPYPIDTIDEDSVGSTIPAFPCSKPSSVTDSPPLLVATSDRIFGTSSTPHANWTTMTASTPSTLPPGTRTHTTTINGMNPNLSIHLRGAIPVVTIMDKPPCTNEMIHDRESPNAYPSPTEPNYYIPLLEPSPPSTMADSITHDLLDSIIRDIMANDTHPTNDNTPHTTPPTVQYTTEAPPAAQQLPPNQNASTTNPANNNNERPPPPSNNNIRDEHNNERADRNNNNEQSNKRTKTATDPNDDIQEFSLRIPSERSVTDTVYQIADQMFKKLTHGETLRFLPSNNTTIPAPPPLRQYCHLPRPSN